VISLKEALSLQEKDDLRFWFLRLYEDDARTTEEHEGALMNIIHIFWRESCNGRLEEYCPTFEEYMAHWVKANAPVVRPKVMSNIVRKYELPEVSHIQVGSTIFT
jgi:hypothetical protein